jgi:uncharacterized protein involved in exopolysaccharide biosynthesis
MTQLPAEMTQERLPDAVTVADIFEAIWRYKWLITAFTLVAIGCSVLASQLTPKVYRSTVLISPVGDEGSGSALGGMVAQIGGLANLVGLGGRGSDRKAEAVAIMQSDALAMDYISKNELLPLLFPDKWDSNQGGWKKDVRTPPSLWQGSRQFAKYRTVSDNAKTGLVQLVIKFTDPVMAARWANDLVALTNERVRREAISLSEKNIAYLNAEAEKSKVIEIRTSIYALLQQEMRALMLARGNDAYAFKVLDPAVPPETPDNLGILAWAALGAIGGCGLGVLVSLLIFGFRR